MHHRIYEIPPFGLSLFKADKTAGSERVSGDKSLLCDGKDSSLERTLLVVGMQS